MNYKITLLLPLLLIFGQGAGLRADPLTPPAPDQDYERKFSESFDVNGRGSVRLENRYGEINVETWDRDRVQIDVVIKVEATSLEKANKTFDRITINFAGSSNRATATTTIGNAESGGFWNKLFGDDIVINFGSSNNSSDFKVHYNVKMPAAATLETVAKYCDVRLPNLSGNNTTEVAYGDVVCGKLSGSNTVQVSYGSVRADELGKTSSLRLRYGKSTIRKADVLSYDGRYSESMIGTANVIKIDAGYEEIEIEKATEVTLRGNYNDIDIREVDVVDFDGSYTDYSFRRINKSIMGNSGYGDIDIDELGSNFSKIDITTRYADVTIGMPAGRGYDLDLSTRYGDISANGKGSLNRTSEGSSASVKGKVNGTGAGTIRVVTAYGDVVLR
ncbi:DUF4097 family beta strand repeat-containing protein [Neolewinella antarctica]|uniref:Adhesin domain-containing protein n=1 Tax=Neolewinella antarctica TaxID=442734 RepID=A0ABX0XDY0_9BACT|nr:DUF4097 family beta strand repeat-containing protein [Neolewinella antarctica]NJC27521.1 hypothetical protein [Neolewinella antarctica]